MVRLVVVRGRVTVRRAVAAPHLSAGEADAEMQPLAARAQALFAPFDRRGQLAQLDLIAVEADAHLVTIVRRLMSMEELPATALVAPVGLPGRLHRAHRETLAFRRRHDRPQLPARADPELGEHLSQMPFDGSRADEELRANLGVRKPVAWKPRDLPLLRRQVIRFL